MRWTLISKEKRPSGNTLHGPGSVSGKNLMSDGSSIVLEAPGICIVGIDARGAKCRELPFPWRAMNAPLLERRALSHNGYTCEM